MLCGKGGKTRHLSIDHDHAIEKEFNRVVVRALLCGRCNRAVGVFEWSDEVLAKAAGYFLRIIELRTRFRLTAGSQEDYIEGPQGQQRTREED